MLASIIFVHEVGHFSMARGLRIHVSKFAVGFGPRLLTYRGGEVEYQLGLVPLGGFVGFPDDDEDCPYPLDDPDLLRNRSIADRAAVALAGVLANCICAEAVLTTQALTVGQTVQTLQPGVVVPELLARSAAGRAGVRPGDIILEVDGQAVAATGDSVERLVRAIGGSAGRPLTFTLLRAGEPQPLRLAVTPDSGSGGSGRIGVTLAANAVTSHVVASSLPEALAAAARDFVRLGGLVGRGLTQLLFHFQDAVSQVSGPVAILSIGAQVARGSDPAGLFQFAAVVNLNLAIVNVLPLPALDGGFLALLALEAVRGKKLDTDVEQAVQALGTLALTGAGIALILRDLTNLAGR